mmetsp:Transcript_15629/g.35845  ORF Transcript_15629/g.35845 Transcript_15629/m.35845 type:complete len:246 (+) Transcript_15629:231-968(+)
MLFMCLVKGESGSCLIREYIPCKNVGIGMSTKQHPSRSRKGNRRESLAFRHFAVFANLVVCAHIKDTCGAVLASRANGDAISHKVHTVDIALVTRKGLRRTGLAVTNIPHLGGSVHADRDKTVGICGADRKTHDIIFVLRKSLHRNAVWNIPHENCGVTRPRQNTLFVKKSTTRQKSIMTGHLLIVVGLTQFVDRAEVVESSTCDQVALRLFHTDRHDISRFEGNRLEFVGRDRIPEQQLSILRR